MGGRDITGILITHFYTTYYLVPKESKNIDGSISWRVQFRSPPLDPKIKSAQNTPKHKKNLVIQFRSPSLQGSSDLAPPGAPPVICYPHLVNNDASLSIERLTCQQSIFQYTKNNHHKLGTIHILTWLLIGTVQSFQFSTVYANSIKVGGWVCRVNLAQRH